MIDFESLSERRKPLAVVGLGYVGLPLAVAFSHHFDVVGFDISERRIEELKSGHDHTREVPEDKLQAAKIRFSTDPAVLRDCAVIIVAVPTPIDSHHSPDLTPVVGSSNTVGSNMSKGVVVCYESTVYPGLTEEICVPIMEKNSGLKFGRDFTVGYSPERINPGDKVHKLETITKIVSGSDKPTSDLLAKIYGTVVKAGIHRASSIKVAEAAKVIENTQRDLNIALMNELSVIFNRMGIDTLEVLEAAGTKWNFLHFRPGLVGGHCIGVDPYYLTFKAEELGYHPDVILSGRRINDDMGKYVAENIVKNLIRADIAVKHAKVAILGFTFKENCPDTRNTKVIDIVKELREYGIEPVLVDQTADRAEAKRLYGVELQDMSAVKDVDALVIAVCHKEFEGLDQAAIESFFNPTNGKKVLVDVKGILNRKEWTRDDCLYWRL